MNPADEKAANDDTMDLKEVAAFLRLGYVATKELVDTGEIPALSCNQKHCVLLREDVLAYVRHKGRQQAEERRQSRQVIALTLQPAPPSRGSKVALPNLALYELTTGARKG